MASERHKAHLRQFVSSHKANQGKARVGADDEASSPAPKGNASTSLKASSTSRSGTTMTPKREDSRNKYSTPQAQGASSKSSKLENSLRPSPSVSYGRMDKRKLAKPTADGLPEEILRFIFSLLNPNDLLLCARVCRRWLELTNDNVIWQHVYKRYALNSKRGQKSAVSHPVNPPAAYWKSLCIQRCSEIRNKTALSLLKKIHPFTGLPANTEQALQKAGVRWCIGLVDSDSQEHVISHRDAFYFSMATCVRWYGLDLPPIARIKKLRIFAAIPVFFDGKGLPHPNSPSQRSLLYEIDFRWSSMSSTMPFVAADDSIKVYIVAGSLLIATFKDGGELAFITACFHYQSLVRRCLQGKSDRPYTEPQHVPTEDDVDTQRGLHGYKITVELRNQRTSFFSQQFRDLYCQREDIGGGYATFHLIQEGKSFEHSPVGKKISFPWKTDLFKGIVQNVCILDLTLLDESGAPMWCVSAPVKVAAPSLADVVYDYDGDHYFIDYIDTKGKLKAKLVWEEEIGQYMIMLMDVQLSTKFISEWFATTL